jgi:hypothetical protein
MSLSHHVEVLTTRHFGTHRLDDRQGTLQSRLLQASTMQHLGRPHDQQIAKQDRARLAEGSRVTQPTGVGMQGFKLAMSGRTPAAQVGRVHQIVVHQGTHMEHIEASCRGQQRLEILI